MRIYLLLILISLVLVSSCTLRQLDKQACVRGNPNDVVRIGNDQTCCYGYTIDFDTSGNRYCVPCEQDVNAWGERHCRPTIVAE